MHGLDRRLRMGENGVSGVLRGQGLGAAVGKSGGGLERLDKGHTRQDFLDALALCRRIGLNMSPTFAAFTPWTTLDDYIELLIVLAEQGLMAHISLIQLAMRLLIPAGSRILELPDVHDVIQAFDDTALTYHW
jgi:hypothetical protein